MCAVPSIYYTRLPFVGSAAHYVYKHKSRQNPQQCAVREQLSSLPSPQAHPMSAPVSSPLGRRHHYSAPKQSLSPWPPLDGAAGTPA